VFELRVKDWEQRVLALAVEADVPSDVLMAGLADVAGRAAAVLDKYVGRVPFSDRMEAFLGRAESAYRRTKQLMKGRKP
jgi:hypothetical protein